MLDAFNESRRSIKWIVNNNRLVFFLVVSTVLAVYYLIGGYGFPDYRNYIVLAENNGYISSPDEYAAEWISRFFLRNGFGLSENAAETVDFFAASIQFFYVVFVLVLMRDNDVLHQRGWLYFTLALSPLLLTTALRAAPAYLIVSYLAYYAKVKTLRFLILALLAISFHDSAILMIAIYILSNIFCYFFGKTTALFLRCVMWVSLVLIIFSKQISFLLMMLVAQFDFGIRAVYFQGGDGNSIAKKIFILLIWFVAFTALSNKESSIRAKVFLCATALLMALTFSISEVAGVRISVYVLGIAVVSKGAFLLSGNRDSKFRQLDLLCGFAYFGLMFYDIFRNVKIS